VNRETGRPDGRPVSGGGVRGTYALMSDVRPPKVDTIDTGKPTTSMDQAHTNRASESVRYALPVLAEFPTDLCLTHFIQKSLSPGVGE
jgi:hypothetical protein